MLTSYKTIRYCCARFNPVKSRGKVLLTHGDTSMKLSKKILTLAALSIASNAISGTMGPVCTPGSVTVPCANNAWDLGVHALYLKPTYTSNTKHFTYGGIQDINGTRIYNDLRIDWDWGFKLEGSYHFNTGNDVNINWYHWETNQTFHYSRPSLDGLNILTLNHQIKPKWDAVNAELGQHVDFGLLKNIRFHGGIQYVRLEQVEHSPYVINGTSTTGINHLDFKYNGIGPRLGADMSYDLTNNFAVYGNLAAALLIGTNEIIDTSSVEPNRGSHTSTVPEFEAKLGVQYSHLINQGALVIDGGYMVVNYFNTFHVIQANDRGETDFALNGPYFGIKWIGNA